jgi:hypothetical protein
MTPNNNQFFQNCLNSTRRLFQNFLKRYLNNPRFNFRFESADYLTEIGFLRFRFGEILSLICVIAIIFSINSLIGAEEFRIDNKITSGNIVVQSKTYLLENDFISLIENNGEITYYNSSRDSFTLLAPSLRIQTNLSMSETKRELDSVLQSIREVKTKTASSRHELILFLANPVFKTELDNKSGQLAIQSNWVDYKLSTDVFTNNNIAKQYFDFCNLTCYLNYRTTNNYRQLFRLEVNRILRNENRFPTNISATFYPSGKNYHKEELISSHKLIKRLTDEDKTTINSIRNSMNTFKTVTFNEYQQAIIEQIKKNQPQNK